MRIERITYTSATGYPLSRSRERADSAERPSGVRGVANTERGLPPHPVAFGDSASPASGRGEGRTRCHPSRRRSAPPQDEDWGSGVRRGLLPQNEGRLSPSRKTRIKPPMA